MSMNGLYRAGLVLFCFSWISFVVVAQQPAASASATEQSQPLAAPARDSRDRQLTLDIVVTDKSGKAVQGLHEQDFVVLDNKRPQKVLSFQATGGSVQAEPPVEIILMIDEVNTPYNTVSFVRDEVKKFLLQNGGELAHPLTLGFFSDSGTQILDGSSRDGKALLAAFDKHETALRTIRRSEGIHGAQERFHLALKTMSALAETAGQTPGRKLVIWISPGWPLLSGPRIQLSEKSQKDIFQSIISASTQLRNARVTLYAVDPLGLADFSRVRDYQEFLKPVLEPKNAQLANLSLQVLTTQSGGLVLVSNSDITGQIQRAVADADAFYTLTVQTPPTEPNQFHAIDVKVEQPGLTVRTRNGYYGQ
jgi:VWFA-related protein